MTSDPPENLSDPVRLTPDFLRLGGLSGREVRVRDLGSRSERARQLGRVGRVDEDAGFRRHELGRAADAGADDRAAAGHGLEQRLAERLDQARLADDGGLRDARRDLVVPDAAGDGDAVAMLELVAERAVADERERSALELAECVGEPAYVLPLGQR